MQLTQKGASMTRYVFEEIKVKRVKKFKDAETGRKRQVTRTFLQTLNPFNVTPEQIPKSRDQILTEINEEANRWVRSNSFEKRGTF